MSSTKLPCIEQEAFMEDVSFPLTLPQSGIYLDQLRRPGSPCYNVGGYLRLGQVDLVRVVSAHSSLVRAHDVFGLRFVVDGDGLRQYLSDTRDDGLPLVDLSDRHDPDDAADRWIEQQFQVPFEIDEHELFRAWLLRLGPSRYRYVGLAHHLIMDGWGFFNWASELAALYDGEQSAQPVPWSDIAADEADYLKGPRYRADTEFWTERFERKSTPAFAWRRDVGDRRSQRHQVSLDAGRVGLLEDAARRHGASPAHVLLALFSLSVGIGAERHELTIDVPFHNRRSAQRRRMLGVFANMVPLRVVASGECSFAELVEGIAREQKACLRHQRFPSSHMAPLGRGSEGLFDIAFNFLGLEGCVRFEGVPVELVYVSHRHEQRALMLTYWATLGSDGAELQLDYGLAHFDEAGIRRLADRLCHLIDALPELGSLRLDHIDLLPDAERRLLLDGFAETDLESDRKACLHTLVERRAESDPHAIAVSSGELSISYAELNGAANALAETLIGHGVEPETLVGIHLPRTIDLPIAVLAVLKAGGSYVPLDQNHPSARLRALIADCGLKLVLGDQDSEPFVRDCGVTLISVANKDGSRTSAPNPRVAALSARNRAYVIYTSGSTGKPKGVEICHRNAVALVQWALRTFSREDLTKVLASTALSFDLSVFELFAPLACGGEVVMVRDALELLKRKVEATLINTVPSAIRVLIDQQGIPAGVRAINLAGEPLPQRTVNDLIEGGLCERVYNLYGPSEDTTYSTCARFDSAIDTVPSIGRAIAGTRAYVLDRHQRLAPFGAKGELYLAGDGVARGYLGRPDLTELSFLPDPYSGDAGRRMYRTGDLVRYRRNGELEYLGRIDDQVKVRGFRIELGEVRAVLEKQRDVSSACVICKEDPVAGTRLVAFVECGSAATDPRALALQLRRTLQDELPSYMVPAAIVPLEKMPQTSNGKVDKASLMAWDVAVADSPVQRPEGDTEKRLAEIWAATLGIEAARVGADSSLFDLGGDSLLLVRMANEIEQSFGVSLTLRDLFAVTDLHGMARLIETETSASQMHRYLEARLRSAEVLGEGAL
jgi:amino acid adenylation domain-containing protein